MGGELPATEFSYRAGLLLGAGLFLGESIGPPWGRGILALAAGLIAFLIVVTMALQWRVMGDWRRRSHLLLLAGFAAALSVPLAGVLAPSFEHSLLPQSLLDAVSAVKREVERLPFILPSLAFLGGVLRFVLLLFILGILILGSGPKQRGGILVVAAMVVFACIVLYPSAETAVGLVFLGLFISAQWERPLLLSDKLRPHLSPMQLDFLRELVTAEKLSPGETKLFMDNDAGSFAQLMELGLARYDSFTREVLPGEKLLHDPASQALEHSLAYLRRFVWLSIGVVYFVMPDIIPGPLDDIVVMLICAGAGFGGLGAIFGRKLPGGKA